MTMLHSVHDKVYYDKYYVWTPDQLYNYCVSEHYLEYTFYLKNQPEFLLKTHFRDCILPPFQVKSTQFSPI
jgi:hypothetical protein